MLCGHFRNWCLHVLFGIANSCEDLQPLLAMLNITSSPLHPRLTPFPGLNCYSSSRVKEFPRHQHCTEPTFAFFRGSFLQFLQAGGCAGPHAWRCWRTLNSIVTKLLSLNITKYKHIYIQFSHTYMEWLCVCVRK